MQAALFMLQIFPAGPEFLDVCGGTLSVPGGC